MSKWTYRIENHHVMDSGHYIQGAVHMTRSADPVAWVRKNIIDGRKYAVADFGNGTYAFTLRQDNGTHILEVYPAN